MSSFSNIKNTFNDIGRATNQGLEAFNSSMQQLNISIKDARTRQQLKQPLKVIIAGFERIDTYEQMIKENKSKNDDFLKSALELIDSDMNSHIIAETENIRKNAIEYFGTDVQDYSLQQIKEITETAIQLIDQHNSDD